MKCVKGLADWKDGQRDLFAKTARKVFQSGRGRILNPSNIKEKITMKRKTISLLLGIPVTREKVWMLV